MLTCQRRLVAGLLAAFLHSKLLSINRALHVLLFGLLPAVGGTIS
jgi:hypothetical protein